MPLVIEFILWTTAIGFFVITYAMLLDFYIRHRDEVWPHDLWN